MSDLNQGQPKMSDPELDELLAQLPDVEPSATLRRAVAEIPLRHPRRFWSFAPSPLGSLGQALLSAALVTALGLLAGYATAESAESQATELDAHAAAEWETLAGLTFADEAELALDEELEP